MEVTFKDNGNSVDVKFIGELDTPATVEVQPTIDKLLELSSKELVIDCSELDYIASSGLRQLIAIHKKCKADGGHMKLAKVQPGVKEIFAVTHFDKVFDIEI